jgi:hypothetical protein
VVGWYTTVAAVWRRPHLACGSATHSAAARSAAAGSAAAGSAAARSAAARSAAARSAAARSAAARSAATLGRFPVDPHIGHYAVSRTHDVVPPPGRQEEYITRPEIESAPGQGALGGIHVYALVAGGHLFGLKLGRVRARGRGGGFILSLNLTLTLAFRSTFASASCSGSRT